MSTRPSPARINNARDHDMGPPFAKVGRLHSTIREVPNSRRASSYHDRRRRIHNIGYDPRVQQSNVQSPQLGTN